MLENNSVLKSKITQLWNKLWSGGISNPLTAIEQISYLLFMKRLDDLDSKRVANSQISRKPYTSKFEGFWIPPEYVFPLDKSKPQQEAEKEKEEKEKPFAVNKQDLRWSQFNQMKPEEMLVHVQTKVFPFLKTLNGDESSFTHYMKDAVFIIQKPSILVEAISTIEEIYEEIEKDANESGQTFQDIQGDVYEMLLSEIATAGKNGQFRTPRQIIKLIAELVEPQLGNRIADPACGTGGFLLGAYQYIVTQLNKNKENAQTDEDGFIRCSVSGLLSQEVSDILNDSLYGYDIDVTMVRLALMNLMMHGVDNPHIDYRDTLSQEFNESNQYQIVMANPPFTGSIDKADINKVFQLNTTKTELLFLENIYNMLKIGGTAGVIVPQGVLFGSNKVFIAARRILIEKCELKAVITMPSGIFKPYAGVSTAILIFTKGGETENVWFYDMQSDGRSLDDKRIKIVGDYGDLQDIVTQFKNRNPNIGSNRKAKFFFVPLNEIVAKNYDLSLNKYKEDTYEEIKYENPEIILAKLKTLENEINSGLVDLERILQ